MSCLDPRLVALLDALRAVASAGKFTVVSEYLGYLPYGQYVHVEVDGIDVSGSLPSSWSGYDLDALAEAGAIEQIEYQELNADGSRTTFRIVR